MSEYRAPWWLPGGHLQTIVAAFSPAPRVTFAREAWETPDGDFIEVDRAGASGAPLLVLFHGLEGSSQSHYARAIAAEALVRGFGFALPHFRGCSGKLNRLPRAYHSGDTDEVDWILRRLAEGGPVAAAGVSLGGNVLLKWLGERAATASRWVHRAAAISAPIDLAACGNTLDCGFNRRTYTRAFLATLKAKALAKRALGHLDFDERRLTAATTLREYDDMITAPLHEFRDADDYWSRASSAPWLAKIEVPTLVLNARNDPFLPADALERAARGASRSLVLEFPDTGGHAGFPGRGRWLSRRVLDFLTTK